MLGDDEVLRLLRRPVYLAAALQQPLQQLALVDLGIRRAQVRSDVGVRTLPFSTPDRGVLRRAPRRAQLHQVVSRIRIDVCFETPTQVVHLSPPLVGFILRYVHSVLRELRQHPMIDLSLFCHVPFAPVRLHHSVAPSFAAVEQYRALQFGVTPRLA